MLSSDAHIAGGRDCIVLGGPFGMDTSRTFDGLEQKMRAVCQQWSVLDSDIDVEIPSALEELRRVVGKQIWSSHGRTLFPNPKGRGTVCDESSNTQFSRLGLNLSETPCGSAWV